MDEREEFQYKVWVLITQTRNKHKPAGAYSPTPSVETWNMVKRAWGYVLDPLADAASLYPHEDGGIL